MTTETDEILSQVPLSKLAAQLGTDEATAREAVEAALPTLLAGVTNEAHDPARASALSEAVRRDHDAATLDADDPLAHIDPAEGDKIVSHVFGSDRGAVESQLQGFLGGTSGSLVQRVLPLLAPLVMSWLARKMGAGRGSGGGGLGDILGGVLGGGSGSAGAGPGSGGGLGDILGGVLGGGSGSAGAGPGSGGGLGDILGQLGGKAGSGGGLDDLLGSILGSGAPAPRQSPQDTGVTDVGDVFGR